MASPCESSEYDQLAVHTYIVLEEKKDAYIGMK